MSWRLMGIGQPVLWVVPTLAFGGEPVSTGATKFKDARGRKRREETAQRWKRAKAWVEDDLGLDPSLRIIYSCRRRLHGPVEEGRMARSSLEANICPFLFLCFR